MGPKRLIGSGTFAILIIGACAIGLAPDSIAQEQLPTVFVSTNTKPDSRDTASSGFKTVKQLPSAIQEAKVIRVVSGDTIDVEIDGKPDRVRMLGIDTPNRANPGYDAATEFTKNEIEAVGNVVWVESRAIIPGGAVADSRDSLGRALRQVWLSGESKLYRGEYFSELQLNQKLLDAGLARVYHNTSSDQPWHWFSRNHTGGQVDIYATPRITGDNLATGANGCVPASPNDDVSFAYCSSPVTGYVGSTIEISGRRGVFTPEPETWAYQWYRDGHKIPGATNRTYWVSSADAGHTLAGKLIARTPGYWQRVAMTNTVNVVAG